ncbi:thiamine-phosphate kinase [Azoarcus sp. PA01]|nr:thiamine-phosphate kinase [Azoarcus sp. PA01]
MPSEFDLIRHHFTRAARHTELAVGDDAALFTPRPGMQLATSTDMLVAGTHFFADTDPEALGWKALAVNLSDLAAMGAEPRWALLALALPAADETWIEAFARGFFACAAQFDVDLAGGDTTRGPLNLCVTITGEVPTGMAVTRAGARPGDDLWITGEPGRGALGLAFLRGDTALDAAAVAPCLDALHRPQPRVAAGLALRGVADAMLDVSDGLVGDLAHILEASGTGAVLDLAALPLGALLAAGADFEFAQRCVLGGGDDYELLFTAAAAQRERLVALARQLDLPFTRIGTITGDAGRLLLRHPDGSERPPACRSYDHFI